MYQAVLRIRVILVRIDPDPDPRICTTDPDRALYVFGLQDANKNKWFLKLFFKVFCLLIFEGTFTSVFNDKKSQNQGFGSVSGSGSAWIRINLSFRIRIRIQIADPDPDPRGQK
jgi:hypothetical protein